MKYLGVVLNDFNIMTARQRDDFIVGFVVMLFFANINSSKGVGLIKKGLDRKGRPQAIGDVSFFLITVHGQYYSFFFLSVSFFRFLRYM